MSKFGTYYARFDGVRGDITGLPKWARFVFVVVTLPGIALVALSFVALIVSIVALLFVAIPVYVLLRMVTGAGRGMETGLVQGQSFDRAPAKHVDVTIRNPDEHVPDEVDGE